MRVKAAPEMFRASTAAKQKASHGEGRDWLFRFLFSADLDPAPLAQRFFLLPKMPLRPSLTVSFIDSA